MPTPTEPQGDPGQRLPTETISREKVCNEANRNGSVCELANGLLALFNVGARGNVVEQLAGGSDIQAGTGST